MLHVERVPPLLHQLQQAHRLLQVERHGVAGLVPQGAAEAGHRDAGAPARALAHREPGRVGRRHPRGEGQEGEGLAGDHLLGLQRLADPRDVDDDVVDVRIEQDLVGPDHEGVGPRGEDRQVDGVGVRDELHEDSVGVEDQAAAGPQAAAQREARRARVVGRGEAGERARGRTRQGRCVGTAQTGQRAELQAVFRVTLQRVEVLQVHPQATVELGLVHRGLLTAG